MDSDFKASSTSGIQIVDDDVPIAGERISPVLGMPVSMINYIRQTLVDLHRTRNIDDVTFNELNNILDNFPSKYFTFRAFTTAFNTRLRRYNRMLSLGQIILDYEINYYTRHFMDQPDTLTGQYALVIQQRRYALLADNAQPIVTAITSADTDRVVAGVPASTYAGLTVTSGAPMPIPVGTTPTIKTIGEMNMGYNGFVNREGRPTRHRPTAINANQLDMIISMIERIHRIPMQVQGDRLEPWHPPMTLPALPGQAPQMIEGQAPLMITGPVAQANQDNDRIVSYQFYGYRDVEARAGSAAGGGPGGDPRRDDAVAYQFGCFKIEWIVIGGVPIFFLSIAGVMAFLIWFYGGEKVMKVAEEISNKIGIAVKELMLFVEIMGGLIVFGGLLFVVHKFADK